MTIGCVGFCASTDRSTLEIRFRLHIAAVDFDGSPITKGATAYGSTFRILGLGIDITSIDDNLAIIVTGDNSFFKFGPRILFLMATSAYAGS